MSNDSEPKKVGDVSAAIVSLTKQIDRCEEISDTLFSRLTCVLHPALTEDAKLAAPANATPVCEMAEHLRELTTRLCKTADKMAEIERRLEL